MTQTPTTAPAVPQETSGSDMLARLRLFYRKLRGLPAPDAYNPLTWLRRQQTEDKDPLTDQDKPKPLFTRPHIDKETANKVVASINNNRGSVLLSVLDDALPAALNTVSKFASQSNALLYDEAGELLGWEETHPDAKSAAALDDDAFEDATGNLRRFEEPKPKVAPAPPEMAALPKGKIPTTGPEAIHYALSQMDTDTVREEQMDIINRKLKSKRPNAVKLLGYLEGFKRTNMQPADLMITKVPVIPPKFRPFSVSGDTFQPGDANELYKDLINIRDAQKELEDALGPAGAASHKLTLYDAVKAVYGYGEPTNPKTRERGVSGFLQKIVGQGSSKFSFPQSVLLGKNQDSVGRGVICVDPNLNLDQIAIPEEMAWKLYAPYIQRRLVRGGIRPTDAVTMLRDRKELARKHLFAEAKERPVIYSRAPSWHRFNVVAGFPKLIPGSTILINPLVTTGLNADFNGDSVALDYGCVPVLIDGKLVLEDFPQLLDKHLTPGFNEDMAISDLGVGTQVYNFTPGRVQVLGMNADGTPGWVDAAAISVHTSHSDECSRVTSMRGVSAVFTSHHNFAKLNDACELAPVKTGDVQVGDLIPLLHGYELPKVGGVPPSSRPIPDTFKAGFWFGHYLGDGSITGRADTISQASVCGNTLTYLEQAADFLDIKPWREGNGCSARWTSRAWVEFLLREIGSGAAGKRLPGWMLGLSEAFKRGLIAGFLAAEGNVAGSTVRVEVVNPSLLVAFRILLESLGVPCKIAPGKQAKGNCQATFVLYASGGQFKELGIEWPAVGKCEQFRNIKDCTRCPDWDRVPLPLWLRAVLLQRSKAFEGGRGRFKTVLRSANVPDYKQTQKGFKNGYCSRKHALRLIDGYLLAEVVDMRVQRWIAMVRETRIAWDVITSKTPVERPMVTYDFSVPGMELFAIQGGFITHNTMNVHLPSMPDAVKDAKEKLLPSKMLWSIKEYGKVVPTPKQELVLGLWTAQNRPAKRKWRFINEAAALKAIRAGQISLSDEVQIG